MNNSGSTGASYSGILCQGSGPPGPSFTGKYNRFGIL